MNNKHNSADGRVRICFRCGGSGSLPQFSHVENGICFRCRGGGVDMYFSSKEEADKYCPPKPNDGDYGVAYDNNVSDSRTYVVNYHTWDKAKFAKGLKKFTGSGKYRVRIVKRVGGKWLDRAQVAANTQ